MTPLLQLKTESSLIKSKLEPFYQDWLQKKIDDPHFCFIYLLIYLQQRSPQHWLGAPLNPKPSLDNSLPQQSMRLKDFFPLTEIFNNSRIQRISSEITVFDLIQSYNFRGIPYSVHRSLTNWMLGEYSLNLTTDIPLPLEVLRMQTQGFRCVSVLTELQQLSSIIDGKRDCFEFTQHDLIHADHFFQNKDFFLGQIGFCNLILKNFENHFFSDLIKTDSVFQSEIEYGISDMNSFCVHLLKYLRAIILGYYLRSENKSYKDSLSTENQKSYQNFYTDLLKTWQMPELAFLSALKINTPQYDSVKDSLILKDFFEQVGLKAKQNWQSNCI